jgi:DNA-binding winged helix-turn-helix (wHTH) protein
MVKSTQTSGGSTFVFGPFEFHPTRRVLMRAGKSLRIGSRAREVLLALLESAGTIVKKRTLIARVWPDTIVEEVALRVHVAELRKLLGDGRNGPRYIENISGIGYRFAELVTGPTKLPYRDFSHGVTSKHFVTIGGPAGAGKSAIALATAQHSQPSYADGVRIIDLGSLTDGALIPAVLAATLGLTSGAQDPMRQIAASLQDKRLLILLDNCEHVAQDAANIAQQLLIASNVPLAFPRMRPVSRSHDSDSRKNAA